jgi:hypothetical protein
MRGAARIGLGLAAALLALAAAVFLFGRAMVQSAIRNALDGQGFESPALRVSELGPGGIVIERLTAGAGPTPDLAIDRIKVRYDLFEAIAKRRVRAVEIGPGRVVATLGKDGGVTLAGFRYKPQKERQPLPFDTLSLKGLKIGLRTPEGEATGALSGEFSQAEGGSFDLAAAAARIGARGIVLTDASASGSLALAKDGALSLKGSAKGDAASPLGAARKAALTFSGNGSSWRETLAGRADMFKVRARVDLQSAEIASATAPALAGVQGFAPFRSLALSGAVAIEADGPRLRLTAPQGPALIARSDAGDVLEITAAEGAPLYLADATGQSARMLARAAGAATGRLRLDASRKGAGSWTFASEGALGAQRFGKTAIRSGAFDAKGTASADLKSFDAETRLALHLSRAAIGRFAVEDAPITASLRIAADLKAETLTIDALPSSCVSLQRGRFAIAGEATEARLTNARLCPNGGPLLAARFGDEPHADAKGRLAASNAFYKIAAATMSGAPPDISFTAAYDPKRNATEVSGALKGGRIALNDLVLLSAADGTFTGGLGPAGLAGGASLNSLLLSHRAEPEQFSPIKARGSARLARDVVEFRFNASTPGGKPLGAGAGFHDVAKGVGDMQFATGKLEFAPRGLQIAGLLPGLRGVVGGATGAVSSDLRAAWKPGADGFSSSGEFRLDDLSFRGPGVAVSQTGGVSGVVRLASLAPLKSDGAQSISIKMIDIGALKLEGGALDFDMPGDETVRVVKGEFPWFGGKIGAYGANAKLGGDSFAVNLRAENVDLKQMLDFLKIPGLSGEGKVEGDLPLVVEGGKSFIRDGEMIATTPGVVRYAGQVTDAAAENNKGAKLAFDLLRELRFQKLGAKIDGPLDGDLKFTIIFEGSNDVVVNDQKVRSPVIYRITLEAPLLALIEQAQVSTNPRLQLERSGVLPEKKVKE